MGAEALALSALIDLCIWSMGEGSNFTVPFSRFNIPIVYLYQHRRVIAYWQLSSAFSPLVLPSYSIRSVSP